MRYRTGINSGIIFVHVTTTCNCFTTKKNTGKLLITNFKANISHLLYFC
jgi:hypothetical protein